MEEKNKRWAFTSWIKPQLKLHLIDYIVWGEEYTPTTGLLHYQGYVEFKNAYSLKYVKSLFKDKTIHLEVARENRECNKLYCLKGVAVLTKFEYDNTPQLNDEVFDFFNIAK